MHKILAAIFIGLMLFATLVFAAETQMTVKALADIRTVISDALTSGSVIFGFF